MNILFKCFLSIFLLIFLSTNKLQAQSNTACKALHRGDFIYGASSNLVQVSIRGKKHIEYHNKGKYYIKSTLEWLSDCEYNMTLKKVTIPNFPYQKGAVMNVKITKVEGNKIYYISTVNGQMWNGVFTKIK